MHGLIKVALGAAAGFIAFLALDPHLADRFPRAPAPLRACLAGLDEPELGYAVAPDGSQAASWGASRVALCDLLVETETSGWIQKGPHLLPRVGVTAGEFLDGELWLGFAGRLEHIDFGPPTGMDGSLYVWDTDPAISISLTPAKLELEGRTVRATAVGGRSVTVPLPH